MRLQRWVWRGASLLALAMGCRAREYVANSTTRDLARVNSAIPSATSATPSATSATPSAAPATPSAANQPELWVHGSVDDGDTIGTGSGTCIENLALDEHALYLQNTRGALSRLERRSGATPQPGATPQLLYRPQAGVASWLGLSRSHVYFDDGPGLARVPKSGGPVQRISRASAIARGPVSDAIGVAWLEYAPAPSHAVTLFALDDGEQTPRELWSYDGSQGSALWVWSGSVRLSAESVTWIAEVPRVRQQPSDANLSGEDTTTLFKVPRRGGRVSTLYNARDGWHLVGDRHLIARYAATGDGAVLVQAQRYGQSMLQVVSEKRPPLTLDMGSNETSIDIIAVEQDKVIWKIREEAALRQSRLDGSGLTEFLPSADWERLSRFGEPLVLSNGREVLAVSPDRVQRFTPQQRAVRAVLVDHEVYLLNLWLHPHGGCLGSSVVHLH